jgi:hypothetical protein
MKKLNAGSMFKSANGDKSVTVIGRHKTGSRHIVVEFFERGVDKYTVLRTRQEIIQYLNGGMQGKL